MKVEENQPRMPKSHYDDMPIAIPCPLCDKPARLSTVYTLDTLFKTGQVRRNVTLSPVYQEKIRTGGAPFGKTAGKIDRAIDKLLGHDRPEDPPEQIETRNTICSTDQAKPFLSAAPVAYVCTKCGHVEWRVNPAFLERFEDELDETP